MTEHANESSTTVHRLVARQPIMGIDDAIVAFQLVHRATPEAQPATPNAADETMTVADLFGDVSVDVGRLVGDLQVYCEPGPGVLDGSTPVTPPTHRTVLDVPADLGSDPELVERCRGFIEEGYSIAVDRFSGQPGVEALLELAEVVKVDLEAHPRPEVLELVARCRPLQVSLLATRCRTEEDLAWAKLAGFTLFQGPAVQRPVEAAGGTLAPSALAQVQLATELLDERLDFGRVEAILAHEPALVAQILHEASLGAGGGLRREVHTVRGALVLMGTVRIRQWAALTVLGRQVSNSRTDALATSLVRARMCELLAPTRGIDRAFAFTAGLLSGLDRLLGVELSEVEERVDVDDKLAGAAFRREGALGELVGLVTDYQELVDNGEPTGPEFGNFELMAAMAFCWAMSHITAMERPPAAA